MIRCSTFVDFIAQRIRQESLRVHSPSWSYLRHRYRCRDVRNICQQLSQSPELLFCFDLILTPKAARNIYARILSALRRMRRKVQFFQTTSKIRLRNGTEITNYRQNKIRILTREITPRKNLKISC